MPTKKPRKRIVTTFEDAEPAEASVPALELDPDEETLSSIMGQFGPGDVVIKVYRQTPNGLEYLYPAGPEVNEESVRASCGPGRYILKVIISGEFRKAIPINIGQTLQQQQGGNGGAPGYDFQRMIFDRLQQLEQRLLQPQAEREPINSVADALVKLNTLGGRTDPLITVETIMKCIEIGKELGGKGGDDWKGIIADVAKEAMPVVGSLLAQRAVTNGGMAGQPQPPTQIGAAPMEDVEEQLKKQLKAGIDFLKSMAIIPDSDPGLWVDVIVARRNEAAFARLIHKSITEEFSSFVAIDPTISSPEYQPFFKSIYDGLRSVFSGAHPVADDSKRPPGNKGNPKGNGRASA